MVGPRPCGKHRIVLATPWTLLIMIIGALLLTTLFGARGEDHTTPPFESSMFSKPSAGHERLVSEGSRMVSALPWLTLLFGGDKTPEKEVLSGAGNQDSHGDEILAPRQLLGASTSPTGSTYCDEPSYNVCHPNALCTPKVNPIEGQRKVSCACKQGYVGDGIRVCEWFDECASNTTNNCAPPDLGGFCEDRRPDDLDVPFYFCGCKKGYTPVRNSSIAPHGHSACVNVNECLSDDNACDPVNGLCEDTEGSYVCSCKPGYELQAENGNICTEVPPSAEAGDNDPCFPGCGSNMECVGTTCVCLPGYELNVAGTSCRTINECSNGDSLCDPNAMCIELDGGYDCLCRGGYSGNGWRCSNVNECALGTHNCHEFGMCIDLEPTETETDQFRCECMVGYKGDGVFNCTNVNECSDDIAEPACPDPNSSCADTEGGFECVCNDGYELSNTTCVDINECSMSPCKELDLKCKNTEGSYVCEGFGPSSSTTAETDLSSAFFVSPLDPRQFAFSFEGLDVTISGPDGKDIDFARAVEISSADGNRTAVTVNSLGLPTRMTFVDSLTNELFQFDFEYPTTGTSGGTFFKATSPADGIEISVPVSSFDDPGGRSLKKNNNIIALEEAQSSLHPPRRLSRKHLSEQRRRSTSRGVRAHNRDHGDSHQNGLATAGVSSVANEESAGSDVRLLDTVTAQTNIFVVECFQNVDPIELRATLSYNNGGGSSIVFPQRISEGQYSVKIPVSETEITDDILDGICTGVNFVGSNVCPLQIEERLPAACGAISTAMLGSVVLAPFAPKVLAACLAASGAFIVACKAYEIAGGGPAAPPGAPNLIDEACQKLVGFVGKVEDLVLPDLSTPLITVSAEARLPSNEFRTGSVSWEPFTEGTFGPSIELQGDGIPEVTEFIVPASRGEGQSYTARALIVCAGDETTAEITIDGTDGYTDRTTCSGSQIKSSGGCSLVVPGAELGVRDTLRLRVNDPSTAEISRVRFLVFA